MGGGYDGSLVTATGGVPSSSDYATPLSVHVTDEQLGDSCTFVQMLTEPATRPA